VVNKSLPIEKLRKHAVPFAGVAQAKISGMYVPGVGGHGFGFSDSAVRIPVYFQRDIFRSEIFIFRTYKPRTNLEMVSAGFRGARVFKLFCSLEAKCVFARFIMGAEQSGPDKEGWLPAEVLNVPRNPCCWRSTDHQREVILPAKILPHNTRSEQVFQLNEYEPSFQNELKMEEQHTPGGKDGESLCHRRASNL
jgi:hypothetical protein